MSDREETQRLLGADGEPSLSAADEQAPPPPPPPAPAIINPPTANITPPTLYPTLGAPPVIMDHNDPPPEYTPVVQGQVPMATNMGYPIQLQLEGQLVPATLMRDMSGKHLVYIEPPQRDPTAAPGQSPASQQRPRDYLFHSILSLFCCLPIGLLAVFRSIEVQRRYARGDYAGAQKASNEAKSLATSAAIFGLAFIVMTIIIRLYLEHQRQQYYY